MFASTDKNRVEYVNKGGLTWWSTSQKSYSGAFEFFFLLLTPYRKSHSVTQGSQTWFELLRSWLTVWKTDRLEMRGNVSTSLSIWKKTDLETLAHLICIIDASVPDEEKGAN